MTDTPRPPAEREPAPNGFPPGFVLPTREEVERAVREGEARLKKENDRLRAENADLRDRPCGHRWTGSEEGIRCLYCGLVE